MKKVISMLFAVLGSASSLLALPVTDGLVMNLDADAIPSSAVAVDGTISTWLDMSGQGNSATQTDALRRPVFISNNIDMKNRACVRFDGVDDWMLLNENMVNVGSCTMFAVAKAIRTTGEQYIVAGQSLVDGVAQNNRLRFATNTNAFEFRVGSSGSYKTPANSANTDVHVFGLNSDAKFYIDGVNFANGSNISVMNPASFNIGSYNRGARNFFQGDIAAVVVFNRVLSDTEVALMNDYFINKYVLGANSPDPANGATSVGTPSGPGNVSFSLQWNSAISDADITKVDPLVKKHMVYLGEGASDANMVLIAEINVTDYNTVANSYGPLIKPYDKTYTWRVDEILADGQGGVRPVDDPNNYKGKNWTFGTLLSVPDITSGPTSARFDLNGTAQLSIAYTSISPATAMWYKDGQPVTIGGRISASLVNGVATLNLTNMVMADEGDYYCVLTSSGGVTTSDSATLMTNRLLASYAFEQNLNDGTGTNHGSPMENPSFVEGISGSYAVASSDGLGYVLLSTDAYPKAGFANGLEQFTYSFWVNPSASYTGDGRIMGNFNDGSNTGVQFGVSGDGTIKTYLREQNNRTVDVSSPAGTVPDEQWSHVAITYTGSVFRYFLNGTMILERNVTTLTNFVDWQYPHFIMAKNLRGTGVTEKYRGSLDDLRIYNYAMDEYQIADLVIDITGEPVCIASERPDVLVDLNNDCSIDLSDLALFAGEWLKTGIYQSGN